MNAQTIFYHQQAQAQKQRNEPIKIRKARIQKIKKWITNNQAEICRAAYQDYQKPQDEALLSEVMPMIVEADHVLMELDQWTKPVKVNAPLLFLGTRAEIRHEPKGVCLIIAPWNFPFNLAIGPLISALAAGNTAFLKPSELTPHMSAIIRKMVETLFEPEEVVVIEGGAECTQELLNLPFDHIFFTGSPSVGKIIMRAASEHLSSITLELGGKSPAIIDKTADLQDAATKVAWGKFLNNGQVCISPDYVLVASALKEAFLTALKTEITRLFEGKDGDFSKSSSYSRIVNERHYLRQKELLEDGQRRGGIIAFGGTSDSPTRYLAPTVVTNLPRDARLLQEEIFGPILPVVAYDSLQEALDMVRSQPKPLALYLFSNDQNTKERVLKETSAGAVVINDCVLHFLHPHLPFGGVNHSGIGKSHGKSGFLAFSNEKPVLKQKTGTTSAKLLYPPYGRRSRFILNFIMRFGRWLS